MLDSFFVALGLKKVALVAGFIGGIISLRFFEGLTAGGKVITASSGAAAANFLTPMTLAWFQLQPESYEGGIGFCLGLFSMSLAAAVIKWLRETSWQDVLGLFGRKGGDR